jgi:hypothetical protein
MLIFLNSSGGVKTLDTPTTNGPIVPTPDQKWLWSSRVEWELAEEIEALKETLLQFHHHKFHMI